jgi:hypothetical protein
MVWLNHSSIPAGRRGGNLLVQMIFTCLRYTWGGGVGALWVCVSDSSKLLHWGAQVGLGHLRLYDQASDGSKLFYRGAQVGLVHCPVSSLFGQLGWGVRIPQRGTQWKVVYIPTRKPY